MGFLKEDQPNLRLKSITARFLIKHGRLSDLNISSKSSDMLSEIELPKGSFLKNSENKGFLNKCCW